jgi:hypothetical protein
MNGRIIFLIRRNILTITYTTKISTDNNLTNTDFIKIITDFISTITDNKKILSLFVLLISDNILLVSDTSKRVSIPIFMLCYESLQFLCVIIFKTISSIASIP